MVFVSNVLHSPSERYRLKRNPIALNGGDEVSVLRSRAEYYQSTFQNDLSLLFRSSMPSERVRHSPQGIQQKECLRSTFVSDQTCVAAGGL